MFEQVSHFISNYCILTKDRFAGQPLQLLDWQREWLQPLYDTVKGGNRVFNRSSVWIPK